MKKRNRRRKTLQVKMATVGWVLLLFLPFVPWIYCSLISLGNDQIATKIKDLEYEKRSLEESLRRQTAEWNQYIEPARLGEAIAEQGLRLNYALPERCVHVAQNGRMTMPATLKRALVAARDGAKGESMQASVTAPRPSRARRTRR